MNIYRHANFAKGTTLSIISLYFDTDFQKNLLNNIKSNTKLMRKNISIFMMCLASGGLHAQTTDSIPVAKQLEEVVVLGDRVWIDEGGVINIIPSKSEKKLSNSPATLIKSLHLPFIKEKDGAIVNAEDDAVPIFINGKRADGMDLMTFWPKEVRRVQYLENPSDPDYEGVKAAVNFIMPEYVVGGVSKVDLFQMIPNYGIYDAASKLVYKKMTYGVIFSGRYDRDHRSGMRGLTQYKDIFYEGKEYDLIEREEERHDFNRSDEISCAFNARYVSDNVRMTHTLSYGWTRNPGSGSDSHDLWTDNMFGSSASSFYSKSYNVSPQVSGDYNFKLTDKWKLIAYWRYAYAKNKNSSVSRTGTAEEIYNSNREEVNSLRFSVSPSFSPSESWMFRFRNECSLDWYSTLYGGSANTKQTQSRQQITSSFVVSWDLSRALSLSAYPGVSVSLWQIGNVRHHAVNPIGDISALWRVSRKLRFSGSLRFGVYSASASESNPVLVKASELLWQKGNPYLNNYSESDIYVSSTYMPKGWLRMLLGVGYSKTFNPIISTYTPASPEAGGLVKELVNTGTYDALRTVLDINGLFLDNQLSVGVAPGWRYYYARGERRGGLGHFQIRGNADYTVGDFRFEVEYQGAGKGLKSSGIERFRWPDRWSASIVYGTGNLYLRCEVQDIFHNKRKEWSCYDSPNYLTEYDSFETGRRFSINLTYTFGYGKKVDKSIDINGPESVESSVMQTNR